jgi:L-ascorbate metabolism protein UlaG (beta-lactamase superfamily)
MVAGALTARRARKTADRIAFLGHATVLVELGGVRLLTDPLLRPRVAHLRRQVAPVDGDLFARPDAVLISHLHHDHLDLASLRMLGAQTPLIVPAGAAAWLRRQGFPAVTELGVGDVTEVAAVAEIGVGDVITVPTAAGVGVDDVGKRRALAVRAVEARHDARRPGAPRAPALGYLMSDARTVYFAGDTARFAGMTALPRPLDVALLPVAGWGPKLGPGHMDPLDAAQAVASIQPRIAIPIHWGTLAPIGRARSYRARLADPPRQFAEHVARLAPSVEVRIVAPGEQTEL